MDDVTRPPDPVPPSWWWRRYWITRAAIIVGSPLLLLLYVSGLVLFHYVFAAPALSGLFRYATWDAVHSWIAREEPVLAHGPTDFCENGRHVTAGGCLDFGYSISPNLLRCYRLLFLNCAELRGTEFAFGEPELLGVQLQAAANPCLHLSDPEPIRRAIREAEAEGQDTAKLRDQLKDEEDLIASCPEDRMLPVNIQYLDETGRAIARIEIPTPDR